ncbi:hypothetical protein EDD37DRAFT_693586 [Exophiala viscosa]|uniref:Glycosyl transferase family 25 domain-containing protein n=1 Tax=Exophiala viscosa TaxID=2486360 RepID=A0AAN6IB61_9EURO|nr:hypothetical protein EDD36DRAFT_421067 [Exophiala viscosa]KAI1624782.1 hypothetical protein EDD37DRAFT_693586 [Exophiala viscosa]
MSLSPASSRKWVYGVFVAGLVLLSLIGFNPALLTDATSQGVSYVYDFPYAPETGLASNQLAKLKAYLPELEDIVSALRKTTMIDQPVSAEWSASIANRTLGFQKVFVLSLPTRPDKRDSISVQASLTEFDVTFVDGVVGSEIGDKALPYTMTGRVNELGCWRAHMNVLQMIVNQNIATALILEDDADWNVGLKAQLVQYARGARYLQDVEENAVTRSAYGDDWDMLWLGHCAAFTNHTDKRRFVIANDPTVEPVGHRHYLEEIPDMSTWDHPSNDVNDTRIVFRSAGGVCTAAQAVSLEGARKALYAMSMTPYNNPVDWGYQNLCNNSEAHFSCISPFPTLFGTSQPAGALNRGSDISSRDGVRPEAHSSKTAFSTRLNIERLILGADKFKSQFPWGAGEEMTYDEITRGVGHAEVLP